jgi:hypothetical protein
VPAALVLDSSVLIATLKPSEAAHADAVDFVARLRAAQATGAAQAFGPAELWLEVYVAEQRLLASPRQAPRAGAMDGLSIQLVAPPDEQSIVVFLEELTRRMRGRRPFSNATDLVYVWAAAAVTATVVTLDEGLLKYHQVVCDVMRPQHVRFD